MQNRHLKAKLSGDNVRRGKTAQDNPYLESAELLPQGSRQANKTVSEIPNIKQGTDRPRSACCLFHREHSAVTRHANERAEP
jgi:hypothetical protein